jgi:hypothetical protein
MNKQQLAAIERVKRALANAERVGLAFAGVDDTLTIFDRAEFDRISAGRGPAEVVNELSDYDSIPIIDSGSS